MAATVQIVNPADGSVAKHPAPAGLSHGDDGLVLCGPTEFIAIAKVRKDQEVWLIEPGLSGGAVIDGEPLTEAVPLSSGVRLTHGGADWLVRLSADAVGFHPAPSKEESAAIAKKQAAKQRRRRTLSMLTSLVVLLLLAAAGAVAGWFYLNQPQPVSLSFNLDPQSVALDGKAVTELESPIQLKPGEYTVEAALPGHAPIRESITIRRGVKNDYTFEFAPFDGILTVLANVEPVTVYVNDEEITGDATFIERPEGEYTVRVEAGEDYIPFEQTVKVAGKRAETVVNAELKPNWGFVKLVTNPPGARVFNTTTGEMIETTPMNLRLLSGNYSFRIEAPEPGYVPHTASVEVRPESNINLGVHTFRIIPGRLTLTTTPPGASVLVNGKTSDSNTPLVVEVSPNKDAVVEIAAKGYKTHSFRLNLKPGEATEYDYAFEALTGKIRIESTPSVAEVLDKDGKRLGLTPLEVTLPAVEQTLTLKKEGYNPDAITLTPLPNQTLIRRAKLVAAADSPLAREEKLADAVKEAPDKITGPHDIKLVKIEPGEFTMGSPKTEPGRMPNEAPVKVRFTLPFYVQTTEVTNAEFRAFKANHDSGRLGHHTFDSDDRPAVSVSWDDAAAFCNHLSQQANLDPVYRKTADGMVAIDPLPNGYRLPTEAEAEYLLRAGSGDDPFPWGAFLPPPQRSGNFADKTAKSVLGEAMPDYDDPFVATAPAGSFKADKNGLYDITGNVAEWTHDTYLAVYPANPSPLVDYTGGKPRAKALRVVRGAGFRDHNAKELRSAYRRTASDPAKDIGFRVVLPLEGAIKNP